VSGWDDLPIEMRGERIDDRTMDQLLRGRLAPDDAPPGYSDVASVLLAAASRPATAELTMQIEHVAAARVAVRGPTGRSGGIRRLTAGLIIAGAFAAIPGLAAANVLPDAAQNAVANVLDQVGISVPNAEDHPAAPTIDHPASTGADVSSMATTTDATGVAKGAAISSLASGGMSQAGQHGQNDASSGSPDAGRAIADQRSAGHSALGAGNAHATPSAKP
jgi:hypothetical protein